MPDTDRQPMKSMRALGVINPGLVTVSQNDDGVEILTFPVKALREQILECMNCLPGGEFVPAAEIKKSLKSWDGKPLTIDHPVNEGGDLEFANRDDVFLQAVKVGEISNPRFIDGFLWVDAHLDRVAASRTTEGRGIVQALLTGSVDVEVSTGYGMDLSMVTGRFDGAKYDYSQKNIEPDHLALLPVGTVGACSVEDGCGAARAAQKRAAAAAKGGTAMNPKAIMDLVRSVLSLNGGLEDEDAIDSTTAEHDGEAGAEPTVNAGDAVDGEVATDDPVSGDDSEPGAGGTPDIFTESEMKRDTLIASLAANASVPFGQDELEGMADEKLDSLAALAGIDCGCADAPAVNSDVEAAPAVEAVESGDDDVVTLTREEHAGLVQLLAGAPGIIDAANKATAAEAAEREQLVSALAANARCELTDSQMQEMKIDALRSLSKSFEAVDYSGRGGPRQFMAANSEDDGFMPIPSWNGTEVTYG